MAMFTMKYFSEGIKVITYAYAHMIIEYYDLKMIF